MAAAPERLRMLDRNEHHLSPETAAAYSKARRSVLREITAVLEDGVAAGQFRKLDSRTAGLALLGMCNWVAWWFEPAPDDPPEPVVQEIVEMALCAVTATGDGTYAAAARRAQARHGRSPQASRVCCPDGRLDTPV